MAADSSAGSGDNRATRREPLASRRKALGLTQEELAALLGVERSTVRRWERGESSPLPWMRPRLARALKVSPNRLAKLLDDDVPVSGTTTDQGGGQEDSRAAAGRDAPQVRFSLPPDAPAFTGRDEELGRITAAAASAAQAGGVVSVGVIEGMPGVGKTTP